MENLSHGQKSKVHRADVKTAGTHFCGYAVSVRCILLYDLPALFLWRCVAYKNVQIAWREDTYFPIVGVLWKACTGQIEPRYTYMGWFCIGIFIVYGYMLYRRYYSMAVFGIISLLVPLTSHVMSTCRFTVGSFVVYMGVYEILKSVHPKIRTAILIFFAFAQIWLLFMWYNSDCWLM